MEKYRSSADPSTGIHPFLPPAVSTPMWSYLLAVFRLPLFIISVTVYAFLSFLSSIFSFFLPAFLSYRLRRFIDVLFLPPLLLSLSIWRLHPVRYERPRTRITTSTRTTATTASIPSRGDIIISNHSSPLDLLYLSYFYSPVFIITSSLTDCDSDSNHVIPLSLTNAISSLSCSFSSSIQQKRNNQSIPLSQFLSQRHSSIAPIVLLAEASRTNGSGILQFPFSFSDSLPSSTRCFVLGLSYSRSRCETRPLPTSLLSHIFYFLCRPSSRIRARLSQSTFSDPLQLQRSVSSLAGVPSLNIGYETGIKFYHHWLSTTSTNNKANIS